MGGDNQPTPGAAAPVAAAQTTTPMANAPTAPSPGDEDGTQGLQQHRLLLSFASSAAEGEYAAEQASSRWRVLTFVGAFDCLMFVVRAAAKLASAEPVGRSLLAQLGNMALLYSLIGLLNARTRRMGVRAAHQEELALCGLVATAISLLLLSLQPANAGDYVYAALFLTCTSAVLKLRWFVGAAALAAPVLVAVAANLRLQWPADAAAADDVCVGAASDAGLAVCEAALPLPLHPPAAGGRGLALAVPGPLPLEALVHILVAWAVGALMAFLSDSSRRESFVAHKLALAAAAKELEEVQARVLMERELAQAQQQAAARALVVVKEKAANEAKSEFMSLMCHEVRTPLNGCLASAEMLLDTQLDEDQRELAKTIRVSGSILLSTVSNFLDFFKMEAGKQLDIVRSPLDLRDLVADVHCIIEAMVGRERGVALLEPDLEGAPTTVLGDPSRICGILLNLYTNAAKYTKRGSIALRVRVVGQAYHPDPALASSFCESSRAGAAASRSAATSAPDSAPDASSCSTPDDVLAAPGGVPLAAAHAGNGGTGKAPPQQPGDPPFRLLAAGDPGERDPAGSLASAAGDGAGMLGGSSDAADAAALLSRQAAAAGVPHAIMSSVTEVDGWSSVHSQPDPHFVLRHASGGGRAAAPSSGSEDEAEARFLCFEVLDTGVGVSRQALESLFQDYVQGTDSEMRRPRAKGGTGLGLSICCKQVAVLGGAIGALSKPACGSVFWFTVPLILPAATASSATSLEEEGSEAAAAAEGSHGTGPPTPGGSHPLTPSQAAGQAAMRRSLEAAQQAATASAAAAAAAGAEGLPCGIPASPARASRPGLHADGGGASARGGGSGSRRQSMDSNLSAMWPSHTHQHHKPRQEAPGGSTEGWEEGAYQPRHALSWEQAPQQQPPSFTAAEMLAAMPLGSGAPSTTSSPDPAARRAAAGPPGAGRHSPRRGAAAAAAASDGGAARSLAGLRVLLAEDNLINQTVAKRVLTSLGCRCRVASNGREAVMAVQEGGGGASAPPYDVILMDMCMPVLGGVEATRELRAAGCHVPIVAMTANASERDRVECIAAGMDGFLSKPVLKEQLTVAIREATQARRRL